MHKSIDIRKIIYIGIFTLCIGFFIGGQLENGLSGNMESDFTTRELLSQINKEQATINNVEKRIKILKKDYNKILKTYTTDENDVLKEQSDAKMAIAGLQMISGEGIVIKIDSFNEENIATKMESKKIFLNIVNDAKKANAEAISINEQRIVNYSDISLAGSLININNTPIAPPYEIKIVGNSEKLSDYFLKKSNYISLIEKAFGIEVNLKKSSKTTVPSLNTQKKFAYIL